MVKSTQSIELKSVLIGNILAEVAVHIWEPENAIRTLICMHGFAGSGLDFKPLAETMVKSGVKVIAPDLFGRGQSTFFMDPKFYTPRAQLIPAQFAMRMAVGPTAHIGTSVGGNLLAGAVSMQRWMSCGFVVNDAAIETNSHVDKFKEMLLQECHTYFLTKEEATNHLLTTRNVTYLTGQRRDDFVEARTMEIDGQWRMRYDPNLGENLKPRPDFSMVHGFKKATCPILFLTGEFSPYKDDPIYEEVAEANPNVSRATLAGEHHPPSLMTDEQILLVSGYLERCYNQSAYAA